MRRSPTMRSGRTPPDACARRCICRRGSSCAMCAGVLSAWPTSSVSTNHRRRGPIPEGEATPVELRSNARRVRLRHESRGRMQEVVAELLDLEFLLGVLEAQCVAQGDHAQYLLSIAYGNVADVELLHHLKHLSARGIGGHGHHVLRHDVADPCRLWIPLLDDDALEQVALRED